MNNANTNEILKSLREQYEKSEFEAVKDTLLKNKDSFSKGEFHYNLGTVYSKMGSFAVGRYHLEKSIHEGYSSTASLHNLNKVKEELLVQDISTSQNLLDVGLSKGLSYSTEAFVLMSLLLLTISLSLFLSKSIKKLWLAIFIIISLTPVIGKYFFLNKLNAAVTFSEVSVFEGPSSIFEETGKLPAGVKVIIGKEKNGWFFIKKPIDYAGWVKSRSVGIL